MPIKYVDIPKMPHHTAEFFQPWSSLERWIEETEDDLGLELNPDFQRGHVWNEEQQTLYVEHILREFRSGRDIYFNHPGWGDDWHGNVQCVDGLQRMTAARRFMKNEIPAFGHFRDDFDKIPFTSIGFNMYIFRLQTRAEVLEWYLNFNSAGTPHSKEEIARVRKLLEESKEA